MNARDALDRLREGNRRWVSGLRSMESLGAAQRRAALAGGQKPFAVVLSCSDSRVPSEMIFDQGLGDLFVVRVAGNVVAPSLVGSIEYAVEAFGAELVVVMGHTACGAVIATLDAIENGRTKGSENLHDIVSRICPAVAPLVASCSDRDVRLELATRANVRRSVEDLRTTSPLLAERARAGHLAIVGAEYSLATGEVDIFEEKPESRAPVTSRMFGRVRTPRSQLRLRA